MAEKEKTYAEEEEILLEASRKLIKGEIGPAERRVLTERYGVGAVFYRELREREQKQRMKKRTASGLVGTD